MTKQVKQPKYLNCLECGDSFKVRRRDQKFCTNRRKRCRWKHWYRTHPRKPVQIETVVSLAMSEFGRRSAEKRRRLKEEKEKENQPNE